MRMNLNVWNKMLTVNFILINGLCVVVAVDLWLTIVINPKGASMLFIRFNRLENDRIRVEDFDHDDCGCTSAYW